MTIQIVFGNSQSSSCLVDVYEFVGSSCRRWSNESGQCNDLYFLEIGNETGKPLHWQCPRYDHRRL